MNRIKRIVAKFTWILAWGSFIFAAIGGLTATNTWIGSWIAGAVRIGPWWLPYPMIVIGLVWLIGDLAKDGIPNRAAVYIAIVWPSLFFAIPEDAKAREKLVGWISWLSDWLDSNIAVWVGSGGSNALMTLTAATCIGAALFWSYRYAQGGVATIAAEPAPAAAATTTTTTSGRGRGRGRR